MTGVEVRKIIKEGFAQLRKTCEIMPDCPQNDKQDSKNGIPRDAKTYCQSLLSNFLKEEDVFTTIDCLLLQANKETRLDFWLNEIDYFLDVEFDNSALIDERKLEKIAKTINDNIDSYLADKKERIDKMLACCANEQDIENLLVKMANEELGSEELKSLEIKEKIKIEIEHLIGEKREYMLGSHCHAILNCG
ncbi:hypothetical protein Ple7327_0969 [Pleurocapsa sp. PCC 7327]|uniref:hypothetical protein n=1 Tax=Pleurocapsa sp. PCC 7327 TaxID=118163 RepID=UPI00029FBA80|nr:hypothetical protein [Pleurocapsa sp. PCC 7327]AFY76390.1 hypothetical protein Ple7327_0969 [Pleurocapsa sp. PCC 7327]